MSKTTKTKTVPWTLPNGRPPIFGWNRLAVGDYRDMILQEVMSARSAATNFKKRNPGWNYKSEKVENGKVRFTRIS